MFIKRRSLSCKHPSLSCPGPWGLSSRSSVPQSGKLGQSSPWRPCGSRLLRRPWRRSSGVWTDESSPGSWKYWNIQTEKQNHQSSLTWLASRPSASGQSSDTWGQTASSSGTGRPACLQEFSPSSLYWTWCCTTTSACRWFFAPSCSAFLLLKRIRTV